MDQAADSEVGLHMASTEPYYTAIIDIVADKSDGLNFVKSFAVKKSLRRCSFWVPRER